MCALALHGYTWYLAAGCASAGNSSADKGEYTRVLPHDIDVEMTGSKMIEDAVDEDGEEEEGHFEQVRRRSKDSPTRP